MNNNTAHETPGMTIALTVSPYRISYQDADQLHALLRQLAPTVREPYYGGGGPNPRADILIQFILEHTASGAIEALAGGGTLLLVKQVVHLIQTRYQRPTKQEQQAPTTSIVLEYATETNENVTVSISTRALLPEQLTQIPDWLAALPNRLHQPPLNNHIVEHVIVPIGYIGVEVEYEDVNDPLRYCSVQGPTMPGGIAVFDTHTHMLIFPFNNVQHRS